MAPIKKNLKHSMLKASTLIEVIVSLVIISIISGLAIMVIMDINSSANNKLKILGLYQLENILSQENPTDNTNEDFQKDNIKIKKICTPFAEDNDLITIQYKVFSNQKKLLFEIKKLSRRSNE